MNLNFLFIQFIGLLAGLFLVFSYFRSDTNKILSFHIISGVLDFFHYFLLGAFSGAFIFLLEGVRDYLYYKTDKDKYIFVVSGIVYIFLSVFQVKIWLDFLPIFASLIDGFSLTFSKKYVTVGACVSYLIWVIYDIYVLSFSGIIIDGFIAVSNMYMLLFFKDHSKVIRGRRIRFNK